MTRLCDLLDLPERIQKTSVRAIMLRSRAVVHFALRQHGVDRLVHGRRTFLTWCARLPHWRTNATTALSEHA
jgi:hypothetical protein